MTSTCVCTPTVDRTPRVRRRGGYAWLLLGLLTTACIVRTGAQRDAHDAKRPVSPALTDATAVTPTPILGLDGPAEEVVVVADNSAQLGVLQGFGASVAWYMDRIVGETPAQTYPLLFADLGLDILRLRNRFERSDPQDAKLEQEVEIVRRATQALGHRPLLLLSSWSPPAALKANGKERCASNANCTLKKSGGKFVYQAFADWWRRSLVHYAKLGLNPDMVSLQNEPDFIPPDWEGCKFEARESNDYPGYGPALQAVHTALQTLKNKPRLIGPEVLGIHYRRMPNYIAELDLTLLDAVAHHTYERGNDEVWDWRDPGPDSFIDEMQEVRELNTQKPLLQTEFGTDEDRGRDGGFETAWMIHNSLVHEEVSGWLYWDLIWPSPRGLASMVGKVPKPRDQYYSLRHYARYTDPGDLRISVTTQNSSLLASGFVSKAADRVTLIVLNTSNDALDAVVNVPNFTSTSSEAFRTVYRPGQSRRWESVALQAGKLRLPSRSIATLILRGGDGH